MTSTSEIKRELISIIINYNQEMTDDLKETLENLHDKIESDKENDWFHNNMQWRD